MLKRAIKYSVKTEDAQLQKLNSIVVQAMEEEKLVSGMMSQNRKEEKDRQWL